MEKVGTSAFGQTEVASGGLPTSTDSVADNFVNYVGEATEATAYNEAVQKTKHCSFFGQNEAGLFLTSLLLNNDLKGFNADTAGQIYKGDFLQILGQFEVLKDIVAQDVSVKENIVKTLQGPYPEDINGFESVIFEDGGLLGLFFSKASPGFYQALVDVLYLETKNFFFPERSN